MKTTHVLVFLFQIISIAYSDSSESYWRFYDGTIPSDALRGDLTDNNLYIGFVTLEDNDSFVPGSISAKTKSFKSEWFGKKVEKSANIMILCTWTPERYVWRDVDVDALDDKTVKKMVRGGNEGLIKSYIGKLFHEGEWKISKVIVDGPWKAMYVWNNNGTSYNTKKFKALMYEDAPRTEIIDKIIYEADDGDAIIRSP